MTDSKSETNQSRLKLFYLTHKGLTIFLVSTGLLFLFLTYPWFYIGGPINGVVIDSLTGKPIEGVVAVMQVNSSGPKIIHGTRHETLYLAESVTDEDGKYHFSFWISKFRPLWLHIGRSPTIGFYKIGYKKNSIYNARHESGEVGIKGARYTKRSELMGRWSIWVGYKPSQNPVLLVKFNNENKEKEFWMKHSGALRWRVGMNGGSCDWETIPNYLIERDRVIRKVKEMLPDKEKIKAGKLLEIQNLKKMINESSWFCKRPKQILSEYLNEIKNGGN